MDTSIHHSGGKCYISRRIFDSCLRANISHQGLSSLSHHRYYMLAPSPQLHPQSLTCSSTVSSYTPFPTRHMHFVYQGYTRTHLPLSISRACVPPAAFYSWSSSSLGPRCLWTLPRLSQEGQWHQWQPQMLPFYFVSAVLLVLVSACESVGHCDL